MSDSSIENADRELWDATRREGDSCRAVLTLLSARDQLETRKETLYCRLRDGAYREHVSKSDTGTSDVRDLVERVFETVVNEDEQRSLIRNAERLFPPSIRDVNLKKMYRSLTSLRNQNQRKKRKAEFELKLRAIYFGNVDAERVEGYVNRIFSVMPTLSDVRFLIKHARAILPLDPNDIVPEEVSASLNKLRDDLRAKRDAGLNALRRSLRDLYADVEPDDVNALLDRVASLFSKTEDLKKLASNTSSYFPDEFEMANAKKIRRAFVKEKRALAGK